MKRFVLLLCLLLCVGCQRPRQPDPPPYGLRFWIPIRPIRVLTDGASQWPNARIAESMDVVASMLAECDIRAMVLEVETTSDPIYTRGDDAADWLGLVYRAHEHATTRHELPIHFVRRAGPYESCANLPNNYGIHAWGIGVGNNAHQGTAAHEVGHAFGLLHLDDEGDSIASHWRDCEGPWRCNLMNACGWQDCAARLEPWQVSRVRCWAYVAPRNIVVRLESKP